MRNSLYLLLGIVLSTKMTAKAEEGVVKNYPLAGQVFEGEIVIDAPPEKIWATLTNLKDFCAIMDFEFQSGKEQVAATGDTARMKVWSDACTYLVTYVATNKELRLAVEPDNASYICQKRWLLTPEGKSTRVRLIDRYTESGEQSAESLRQQVEAWKGSLAHLKAMAEK